MILKLFQDTMSFGISLKRHFSANEVVESNEADVYLQQGVSTLPRLPSATRRRGFLRAQRIFGNFMFIWRAAAIPDFW